MAEILDWVNFVLNLACVLMITTLLVISAQNRRRFAKHLDYVEKKTDEYLTIIKQVGALTTGRIGQAQKDLERTGDKIQHKLTETGQEIRKEVIQTVATTTTERFPKMDTDLPPAPETGKIPKMGDERNL